MRVPRPLLRPHPPSVLVTPCPLLEKEDCHHEGADLREVRVPCGLGHAHLQAGPSIPRSPRTLASLDCGTAEIHPLSP